MKEAIAMPEKLHDENDSVLFGQVSKTAGLRFITYCVQVH